MGSRRGDVRKKQIMTAPRTGYRQEIPLSLFWIGTGCFFLWFSLDIQGSQVVSDGDPGLRFFPQCLGLAILLGGLLGLLRPMFGQLQASPVVTSSEKITESATEYVRHPLNALAVLISIALYIPAVNFLGFTFSTLVLVTGLLVFLGSRWWISILVACSLVLLIQVLFGYALSVPLPTNYWGLMLPGGFPF